MIFAADASVADDAGDATVGAAVAEAAVDADP
jgi:hypothetical protein